MKEIPLNRKYGRGQGLVALVDDEDYERVAAFSWHANFHHGNVYVETNTMIDGKKRPISMHRFIIGFPKHWVDHINHNGLDNRRCNLRESDGKRNQYNRRLAKSNTVGFKGVERHNQGFCAYICPDGRKLYLGTFSSPQLAAQRYDQEAVARYGEHAMTNAAMGLL